MKKAPADVQERVHLYNVAAGGTSEGFVPFTSSGGTGDHVGGHNMWTMTTNDLEHPKDDSYGYPVAPRKPVEDGANKLLPGEIDLRKKNQEIIQVPSMRLDDIVEKTADGVFLLKVDTQGFEPTVLSGLTKSLTQHNVQYLLMEYWPRGMDLLAGEKDACIGAKLLQTLVDNGYTLYALNVQAHPKAPQGWKSLVSSRPMDNLQENCRWYFSVEDKLPSVEYKMGYWSDILAVAPTAQLSGAQTRTGMALQSGLVMQK